MAIQQGDCDSTPSGDDVCYPGADGRYNQCYTLDPMSNPPPSGYDYNENCEASYGAQYQSPDMLLDLTTADPDDHIAPNFKLDELAHEWKGQYAVLQVHAVDKLQQLRDRLGPLVIISGYRSPGYNASVDGATCSRHMYGDAFNIQPQSSSFDALVDACEALGAGYIGVYNEWVHCDWRYDKLDPAYYHGGSRLAYDDLPVLDARLEVHDGVWTAPATGWDEGEPLREWTAFDQAGKVLTTARGASFVAPAGTAEVQVEVGMAITRRQAVTDSE